MDDRGGRTNYDQQSKGLKRFSDSHRPSRTSKGIQGTGQGSPGSAFHLSRDPASTVVEGEEEDEEEGEDEEEEEEEEEEEVLREKKPDEIDDSSL